MKYDHMNMWKQVSPRPVKDEDEASGKLVVFGFHSALNFQLKLKYPCTSINWEPQALSSSSNFQV